MDRNTHNVEIDADTTMEQAHQTYSLLNEEVRRWQDERGSVLIEKLSPAETTPYYPLVDFPDMVVLELWKRLNRVIGVLVSESVLRETWNEFKTGQPVSCPELLSSLQIALSGIAHLIRVNGPIPASVVVESSGCPICGEGAAFSVITLPNGKRCLHCALCGHEWPRSRVGCIRCGSEDASKQNYLNSGEFLGIEVVACEACGQYFKEFDLRARFVEDFVWEDVRTLPLNYAAVQWLAERAKVSGKVQ